MSKEISIQQYRQKMDGFNYLIEVLYRSTPECKRDQVFYLKHRKLLYRIDKFAERYDKYD